MKTTHSLIIYAALVTSCVSLAACRPKNDTLPSVESITESQLHTLIQRHKGKVILVNVWATWCSPCREEMPSLVRLRKEFRDREFELILVSADDPDIARTKIERTLKDLGVDFPSYINTSGDEAFIDALSPEWSGALPTSFVYDPEGKLTDILVGRQSYEVFRKALSKVIIPRGRT